MKKILVIGQTPPPHHGQAIMIERMLQGSYSNATLHHVQMAFSGDMKTVGRWRLSKVFHALSVVVRATWMRLRHGIDVLYYPPAGPDRLPMLRDMAILLCVRWMFSKTIFHFHAAGISELYARLPAFLQVLFRWTYFEPDLSIQVSPFNPDDGTVLRAKNTRIIAYGIEDENAVHQAANRREPEVCTLLSVGIICESKGICVLIDAIRLVKERGVRVEVNVVGEFISEQFRRTVFDRIARHGLEGYFNFKGVLTGRAKHEQYLDADIFCFPTFYQSESFGLVVVEAMQFCVPVIVTRWRGVQSLITDGEEGFVIPVQDSEALADRIITLAADPALRRQLGLAGRARFLREYTAEKFRQRMDECFGSVMAG